ncbi:MAG: acyloxyacyl hydrolase [Campylobacteraceae bacterium]|nr:acyloxyacyl hydrolase [Campylobacteraceae bacterium]
MVDSISMTIGKSKEGHSSSKISLQHNFDSILYTTDSGYIDGFYELSFSNWGTSNNVKVVSFSPVLMYSFDTDFKNITPYIQFGIGGCYLADSVVGGKDVSTHFQFEDRIGIGFKTEDYRIDLNFFHYSNADIEKPNPGVDFYMLTFVYPLDY